MTAEAVLWVAGAGHLAAEAIETFRAETFRAAVPSEAVFAETRTIGSKAAGTRGTVTHLSTVLPEAAHGALLTAPSPSEAGGTETLPSEPVAETSIVTATFQRAVGSVEALRAGQGAYDAHPSWGAAAGALVRLENTPIVARMGVETEEARSV